MKLSFRPRNEYPRTGLVYRELVHHREQFPLDDLCYGKFYDDDPWFQF